MAEMLALLNGHTINDSKPLVHIAMLRTALLIGLELLRGNRMSLRAAYHPTLKQTLLKSILIDPTFSAPTAV